MIKTSVLGLSTLLLSACVPREPEVIHTESHEIIEVQEVPVIYDDVYQEDDLL
ncbi:hypothetical protein [Enterobacter wuhouensis]|uniref:hypothetical protein n=1 Tax=Enterobacter wuhouensis TaxID=2529381 RepID=UPI003525904A